MNEKFNENQETPLNVSNSDNEQMPLANQDTNAPESSNFNNPSRENELIGEKISNLDFLVCSDTPKNDHNKNIQGTECRMGEIFNINLYKNFSLTFIFLFLFFVENFIC